MKFTKDKFSISVIAISTLMIIFFTALYIQSMNDIYKITMKQYQNIIIKNKEYHIREVVDKAINNIELVREHIFDEYSKKIENIKLFIDLNYNSVDYGKKMKEMLDAFCKNDIFKYIHISNNKVVETNEKSINIDQVFNIKEFDVESMYEFYFKINSPKTTLIIGVKAIDIDNKVKLVLKELLEDKNLKDGNYIWIDEIISYDGGDNFAKEIVNEGNSKNNSYISTNDKDVNGEAYFEKILKDINKHGESINKYYYYKEDTNEVKPKMSYIKLYEPYDWMIGTGIYLDDIEKIVKDELKSYVDNNKGYVTLSMAITGLIILIVGATERILFRSYELKKRNLLKQENEIIKNHYEIIEDKYNKTNKIIHDFKNHLIVIQGLIIKRKSCEVNRYIENINGEIKSTSYIVISKNKIIDIIINEKYYVMNDEGIAFKHNIEYINFEYINNTDLSVIFGNILDNAIESCIKSDEKIINLEIYSHNDRFIVIKLENTCSQRPNVKDGKLLTIKQNKSLHGYGINNINKAIKRYDGNMTWKYDEDKSIFTVVIVIPIKVEDIKY